MILSWACVGMGQSSHRESAFRCCIPRTMLISQNSLSSIATQAFGAHPGQKKKRKKKKSFRTWEEILTFLTPIENPFPASHCLHLCLEVPERNSTEYSSAVWGSRLSFQRTTIYSPWQFTVGSGDTYFNSTKVTYLSLREDYISQRFRFINNNNP